MTYSEQLQIIQNISIREGERRIITCPICYGSKKMSLSKADGQLMWNCFRASCNARGIHSGRRSIQSTKDYISQKSKGRIEGRPIPSITTSVENHRPAIDYLKSVNSWGAYSEGLINVRYDPASGRILFLQAKGAVGRLLSGFGPKWVTFGTIEGGVEVGSGNTVVIVEDIPSACSVSRLTGHVGLALLGTKISPSIKNTLSKYKIKYLVLDKDASALAVLQVRKLGNDCRVRLTQQDLKSLTITKIKRLLSVAICN